MMMTCCFPKLSGCCFRGKADVKTTTGHENGAFDGSGNKPPPIPPLLPNSEHNYEQPMSSTKQVDISKQTSAREPEECIHQINSATVAARAQTQTHDLEQHSNQIISVTEPNQPQASKGDSTQTNSGTGLTMNRQYTCNYDYDASHETCLSCKKGQIVTVLNSASEWTYVKTENGCKGYIETKCIDPELAVQSHEWYFGSISREECKNRLMEPPLKAGRFMVRKTSKHGHVSIGVVSTDMTVRHILVPLDEPEFYSANFGGNFWNVPSMIEYCQRNTLEKLGLLTEVCGKGAEPLEKKSAQMQTVAIDRNTLLFEEKIGVGQFGEVYKGTMLGLPISVAIKLAKPEVVDDTDLIKEATTMKYLQHKNIVPLYAVVVEEPVCIVTEYMSGGSLSEYLRKHKSRAFSFEKRIYCATQIAEGMAYLEENHYIHRDLRASNVLVGSRLVCKVSDLGLARCMNQEVYNSKCETYPVRWAAPEVLRQNIFSHESDMWSYGVLLYEIVTDASLPYKSMKKNEEVINYVCHDGILPRPKSCNEPLYERMQWCWKQNPNERPSFASTLDFFRHKFECSDENYFKFRKISM